VVNFPDFWRIGVVQFDEIDRLRMPKYIDSLNKLEYFLLK
jgi:hypothetical protein